MTAAQPQDPPKSPEPRRTRTESASSARRRWVLPAVVLVVLALLGGAAAVLFPWWRDGRMVPAPTRLAAGAAHTCVVTNEGTARCWGDNTDGQLGNGSFTSSPTPVEVVGLPDRVVSLTGTGRHVCALTASGSVWCWGANAAGQLGDGTTTGSSVPLPVPGLESGVLAISAGASHSCALTGSRAVRCWGENGMGQLGAGDAVSRTNVVEVAGLPPRSTALTVGNGFTCVGFTGRTVRCWGDNSDGQLGLGDTAARISWAPLTELPRSSSVSAGDLHACALAHSGDVWCWGANWAGQLGLSTDGSPSTVPLQVPGLPHGVVALTAGYNSTCALDEAGTVTCWGGRTAGSAAEAAVPLAVPNLEGVAEVAVGTGHSCALTGGGVTCWGANGSGQLGDGSFEDSPTPVQVAGL